jgi:hypothetical protein
MFLGLDYIVVSAWKVVSIKKKNFLEVNYFMIFSSVIKNKLKNIFFRV